MMRALLPEPFKMSFARLVVLVLLPGAALAQPWPAQPITIVMGFPAGSGVDVVARMVQEPMEKSLGTKLVMDYRTGAGGNLASEAVSRARPDGYNRSGEDTSERQS